jgi:membrane-bound lytic murein transglycosylase D
MFRVKSFIILILSFVTSGIIAQTTQLNPLVGGTPAQTDIIDIPDDVRYTLDHMLSNWMIRNHATIPCEPEKSVPDVPDSVVMKRLALMPCVMEMPFNQHVRGFIDMYTQRRRRQVSYLLGMGDYYFRIFEEVLEKNKLPLELKYLPVIESAMNATAVSRAGAAGLWQFMLGTGRMYGLEVNSLVDERLDPYKSTHAAAEFLKNLFEIYGDWHLVIAAYNCGPGNVNKAIRRAGGKHDYWAIYPFLPKETRGYVPIFIAANYAMHYAPAHGICKAEINYPRTVDTVVVNQRIHFEQIAVVLDVPVGHLRLLNPQYKVNIIPGDLKPYAVALPVNMTGRFIDKLEEIAAYKADSLINNRRESVTPSGTQTAAVSTQNRQGNVIYHTVKSGQTLGSIAARYGVSVNKIKQWNNISGTLIREGQKLKIIK